MGDLARLFWFSVVRSVGVAKTIAVVPARSGSKGLAHKNIRNFLGETLLGRAVRVAMETCDAVVVTTDSEEYAALALGAVRRVAVGLPQAMIGVKVDIHMRPPELATDEAAMIGVVQDAINGRPGDVVVLLQPTMPARDPAVIRQAVKMLEETRANSVVTVRPVPAAYSPDLAMFDGNGILTCATSWGDHLTRRQDARQAYIRDGTVYVTQRQVVEGGSLYGWTCRRIILPGEFGSIDTAEDFERLERAMDPCESDALPSRGATPLRVIS